MEQLRAIYDYDSLPYVDKEFEHPMVQQAVTLMIEAEMQTFSPNPEAYLKDYPYPHLSARVRTMIKAHEEKLEGAAAGGSWGGIDLARYGPLEAPSSSSSSSGSSSSSKGKRADKEEYPFAESCGEWHQAVNKGKTMVEYQDNRLLHLELQVQHIAPLWQAHIAAVEGATGTLQGKLREAEAGCNAINYERKVEQEKAGRELATLLRKRDNAVREQMNLKHAIAVKRAKM